MSAVRPRSVRHLRLREQLARRRGVNSPPCSGGMPWNVVRGRSPGDGVAAYAVIAAAAAAGSRDRFAAGVDGHAMIVSTCGRRSAS